MKLSLQPKYTTIQNRLQYNETATAQGARRDIVSFLDQNTLSFAIRADVVISPNIAIQYYGEPFISSGTYDRFGYVDQPLEQVGNGQIYYFENEREEWSIWDIDEDQNGTVDYTIGNPDFSFAQFRSNLVFRWEYRPGSELFVVWAQGLTDTGLPSRRLFESLQNQIFSQQLENTFLIKMTYRFHR